MDLLSTLFSVVLAKPAVIEEPIEKVASLEVVQVEKFDDSDENYIEDSLSGCKVYNPSPENLLKAEWDGECKEGYSEGKGKLTWYYSNGFKDKESTTYHTKGKYTGLVNSTLYDASGNVYMVVSGNAVNNALNGQGQYRMSSGTTFKGGFKAGMKDGYGKYVIPQTSANQGQINFWQERSIGSVNGDNYMVEGLFKDDQLVVECNKEECPIG